MDLGLSERVAIVTGASRGIGLATAHALAEEGACLVLCARDPKQLEQAVDDLRARGAMATAVVGDVLAPTTTQALVTAATSTFGRLDIIINNAGGESGRLGFEQLEDEDWERVFRLNVVAPVRLMRAAIPLMRERGWGRIVNVSSYVARVPEPFCLPYAAAKAALVNITRGVARTCTRDGVLVNCVLPGLTGTDGVLSGLAHAAAATGREQEDLLGAMLRRAPIDAERMGEPAEVAAVVAFLVSEQASWTAGAAYLVDGGTVRTA